ncbi:unnamed protein product [Protopolystoma xenopodis]|uniref:Uncharacterized protein n=1 Tax=Protopolystoma xenopodis TaxID=117903 RepID=A0A448XQ01_9PLAT|nr:unnamed protein product [Protopolystoma xenopodis]
MRHLLKKNMPNALGQVNKTYRTHLDLINTVRYYEISNFPNRYAVITAAMPVVIGGADRLSCVNSLGRDQV